MTARRVVPIIDETGNSDDLLDRQFAFTQKIWKELAAPLRTEDPAAALEAYQVLQKVKERLSRRAAELKEKVRKEASLDGFFQAMVAALHGCVKELSGVEDRSVLHGGLGAHVNEAFQRTLDTKLREFRPDDWEGWAFVQQPIDRSQMELAERLGWPSVEIGRYMKYKWNAKHRWTWHRKLEDENGPADGKARWTFSVWISAEVLKGMRIDLDALESRESLQFSEDSTWREAIEKMQELAARHQEMGDSLSRTVDLVEHRLSVLNNILYQYEVFGGVEPLSLRRLEQIIWEEARPLAKHLARIGLKLYNADPDKFSSRSDLLKELLKESTADDVRTLQDQLGVLYPKGETPGRPTKEEKKALLDEMIELFSIIEKIDKTGETGENGAEK